MGFEPTVCFRNRIKSPLPSSTLGTGPKLCSQKMGGCDLRPPRPKQLTCYIARCYMPVRLAGRGRPRIRSYPRSCFIVYSISTGTSQYPFCLVSCGVKTVQPFFANSSCFCEINDLTELTGSDGIRVLSYSYSMYAASQSSVMLKPRLSRRASNKAAKILAYRPVNCPRSHSGLIRYRVGFPHVGQ